MTHTRLTQLVQALLDAPTSNETVNLLHKSLAKKAQLTYYNMLKTLKQKAQNSATALAV